MSALTGDEEVSLKGAEKWSENWRGYEGQGRFPLNLGDANQNTGTDLTGEENVPVEKETESAKWWE